MAKKVVRTGGVPPPVTEKEPYLHTTSVKTIKLIQKSQRRHSLLVLHVREGKRGHESEMREGQRWE